MPIVSLNSLGALERKKSLLIFFPFHLLCSHNLKLNMPSYRGELPSVAKEHLLTFEWILLGGLISIFSASGMEITCS